MPIKPENASRYPPDWPEIRARILRRAGDRCEECGARNHDYGYWKGERFVSLGQEIDQTADAMQLLDGVKVIRIVLTVAHLDHMPENCQLLNLRALCQRHHNRYDREHRNATASHTRSVRPGQADLFLTEKSAGVAG